jgi:hypothetical protein
MGSVAAVCRFLPARRRRAAWTLVGDYLKVTCWVLAMPMLAIADMKTFLATDLTAQTVFAGSALAFSAVFKPSEATAIAFVVCYVVNLATCYS